MRVTGDFEKRCAGGTEVDEAMGDIPSRQNILCKVSEIGGYKVYLWNWKKAKVARVEMEEETGARMFKITIAKQCIQPKCPLTDE